MVTFRLRDALVVGGLLLAGVLYFVLAQRAPDEQIREQLRLLGRHAEQTPPVARTIDRVLSPFVEPDVRLHIPEIGATAGRSAAAELLSETKLSYPSVSLRFEKIHVDLDQDQNGATVQADVTLRLERAGRVQTDERRVTLRMQRSDDHEWRLASADVAAKTNEQPEARP